MLKYIVVFVVTTALLATSLILSALIPKAAIFDNMFSSAKILCERRVFFQLWEDIPASKIDRYADSILLSISYQLDRNDPVASSMRTAYYNDPFENENENFLNSLIEGHEANTQYMRYWHGSAVFVRLSHLFTDINGMYIMSAIIMVILTALLLILLIKNKLYVSAAGIICAFAVVGIWFVPFSLEYIWSFMVALVMSIIAVWLSLREKYSLLLTLFLVCGMVLIFLDFLTCETLTLLLPLIMVVDIRSKKQQAAIKSTIFFSIKSCVLWGVGYVGMWVTKWVSAAVVLGEDVTPYITEHITERLGVKESELSPGFILEMLWRNISCLFPGCLGGVGVIAAVIIILAIAYVCFVYRKRGADKKLILLYAVLGLVPFVRFLVLHNHSYLHYFFTYRALAATVLSICFIIAEVIGLGRAKVETKKRKKA